MASFLVARSGEVHARPLGVPGPGAVKTNGYDGRGLLCSPPFAAAPRGRPGPARWSGRQTSTAWKWLPDCLGDRATQEQRRTNRSRDRGCTQVGTLTQMVVRSSGPREQHGSVGAALGVRVTSPNLSRSLPPG